MGSASSVSSLPPDFSPITKTDDSAGLIPKQLKGNTMSLLDNIKAHVSDESISGLVFEVDYEPLSGPATPVAPPTYAPKEKGGPAQHAFTPEAFVPEPADGGWYSGLQRNQDSTPRLASRIVLNSVQAQAGRAELAAWRCQDRLGLRLPGIIVDGRPAAETAKDPQLADALRRSFSTWELAHRQNDAWIKFATTDDKRLVWQQDVGTIEGTADASRVKSLIAAASAERADLLYRYFPNAAIFGFWVSSGVAARHRLARAFSSEIVGLGAHPVASGATKLDPTGGAINTTGVTVNSDNSLTVKATSTKQTRPSLAGFGQIPAQPGTRSFLCEFILEQGSVSLQLLRSLRYPNQEQSVTATTVLTLLSLAGHALATEDGFLRSGCALVPVDERWGWRRRGQRTPEALPVATLAEIAEALHEAILEAEGVGLSFAEPITLQFSGPELEIIGQRVASDAKTLISEE
ncbi:type I-G CRISPR-associated protein Cas7 [Tessaracoccus caeni]|uniref:type I-G CRISPR-associated protein Cas7 n=1 Tax=Tessaracoccus caeni TaxID=3031239 RepID=UPI0023DCB7C6|nr:type I-U CRISPR-associated protein Cas7 [Tessaracoccus caeni]MDF1489856.1 type I-U CRISPR-associated protein Cas7 [Tessaracoccus caeni]